MTAKESLILAALRSECSILEREIDELPMEPMELQWRRDQITNNYAEIARIRGKYSRKNAYGTSAPKVGVKIKNVWPSIDRAFQMQPAKKKG